MPEFRTHVTIGIDYEVYFDAADEDAAETLAERIAEQLSYHIYPPNEDQLSKYAEVPVLSIDYDGVNEATVNDVYEEDEDY
jgi:hypothetical protein